MSAQVDRWGSLSDVGAAVWRVVGVPFRVQTYKNLLYLGLAFPLGLVYFVVLVSGFATSAALLVVLVGAPLLVFMLAATTGIARFEAVLADGLLPFDVETRSGTVAPSDDIVAYVKDLLTDIGTYVSLLYVASKFVVGLVSFVAMTVLGAVSLSMLAAPLLYDGPARYGFFFPEPVTINPRFEVVMDLWSVTVSPVIELTTWQVTTMGEALVFSAMGVVALVVGLHLLNAFAWLLGYVTTRTFEYARVLEL